MPRGDWQQGAAQTDDDDLVRQLLEANDVDDVVARMERDYHRHIDPTVKNLSAFDRKPSPQTPRGGGSTANNDNERSSRAPQQQQQLYTEPDPYNPRHRQQQERTGSPVPAAPEGMAPPAPSGNRYGGGAPDPYQDPGRPLSRTSSYGKYANRPPLPQQPRHDPYSNDDNVSNAGSRHGGGAGLIPPPTPPSPRRYSAAADGIPTDGLESYRRLNLPSPGSASLSLEIPPASGGRDRYNNDGGSSLSGRRPGSAYARRYGDGERTPRAADAMRSWEADTAALVPRVVSSSRSAALGPDAGGLEDPARTRVGRQLQLLRNYRQLAELCSQTDNPAYNHFSTIPPEQLARLQAEQLRNQLANSGSGEQREASPINVSNNYYFTGGPPPATPPPAHADRGARHKFDSVLGGRGDRTPSEGHATTAQSSRRQPPGLMNISSRPPLQSPRASADRDSPNAVEYGTPNDRSTATLGGRSGPYLSPAPSPPHTPAPRSPRGKPRRDPAYRMTNAYGGAVDFGGRDILTATTEEAGTSHGDDDYDDEEDFQGDFMGDDGVDYESFYKQPPRIIEREQHRRFAPGTKPLPGTNNVTITPNFAIAGNTRPGNTMSSNININSNSNHPSGSHVLTSNNSGGASRPANSGSYNALTTAALHSGGGGGDGGDGTPRSKAASMINVLHGKDELIADGAGSQRRASSFSPGNTSNAGAGGGGRGGGGGGDDLTGDTLDDSPLGNSQQQRRGGGGGGPSPLKNGRRDVTPEKRYHRGDDEFDSDFDNTPFNAQLQTHNPSASAARKQRTDRRRSQQPQQGRSPRGIMRNDSNNNQNGGRGGGDPRSRNRDRDRGNDGVDSYGYSYSLTSDDSDISFERGGGGGRDSRGRRVDPSRGRRPSVQQGRQSPRSGTRPGAVSPRSGGGGGGGNSRYPNPGGQGRPNSPGGYGNNNANSNGNDPCRRQMSPASRNAAGRPNQSAQRPGQQQQQQQRPQQQQYPSSASRGRPGMEPSGPMNSSRPYGAGGSPQRQQQQRQQQQQHGPGARPMQGSQAPGGGRGGRRVVTLPDGRRVAVPENGGQQQQPQQQRPGSQYNGGNSMMLPQSPQQQPGMYPQQRQQQQQPVFDSMGRPMQPMGATGGGIFKNPGAGGRPSVSLAPSQYGGGGMGMGRAGTPSRRAGSVGTHRASSAPRMQPGLLYGSLLPNARVETALIIAPDDHGHIVTGGVNPIDGTILPVMDHDPLDDSFDFFPEQPAALDASAMAPGDPGRQVEPLVWKSGNTGVVVGRNQRIPANSSAKLSSHYRKPDPVRQASDSAYQPMQMPQQQQQMPQQSVQRVLPLQQPQASALRSMQVNDQQRQFQEQKLRQQQFHTQQQQMQQLQTQQQQQQQSSYRSPAAVTAAAGMNPNQMRYGGSIQGGSGHQSNAPQANPMAQLNAQRFGIAQLN